MPAEDDREALARRRAQSVERFERALCATVEQLARHQEAVRTESDAFWERREAFDRRAAERKKLAQLVVHDLKNHLAVMKTNVEYALLDVPADAPGGADLAGAARALDACFKLAAELVTVEQGPGRARQPVALTAASARAVDDSTDLARARGVRVASSVEGAPSCAGDARLVARVIANVLDNAVRHGGGEVRLSSRGVTEGMAVLTVEDEGPGLPASRRVEGAPPGSGLAFCADAMGHLGGAIAIEPAGPQGTRVTLRFVAAHSLRAAA